jgi:hypothetical protein
MAIVRAAVLRRKNNKDFLVRPSVAFLEAGDVFRLVNGTAYDITIAPSTSPGAGPRQKLVALLGLPGRHPSQKVKKGNSHDVSVPFPKTGKRHAQNMLCRYQVTVHVPGRPVLAAGDSDPVIIVDNP